MPVITLHNISKTFKGQTLFRNLSAEFDAGKTYAIIGHNGAGKSVLFKMICGFVKPDSGQVEIDSAYMSKDRSFPENFGIIIDRPGYLPHLRGFENLKRLAEIRGTIGPKEISAAMERVGLDPNALQKVRNYSLGMKQKLALAQATMENQQILLLDEPFNGLDKASVEQVRSLLTAFHDEGRTIIFTSHNSKDVELLAEHVFLINDHKIEVES